jgi:hypothetical protein
MGEGRFKTSLYYASKRDLFKKNVYSEEAFDEGGVVSLRSSSAVSFRVVIPSGKPQLIRSSLR